MNSAAAADGDSRCTRDDRKNTIPSWATTSARNSGPRRAIVVRIAGDEATYQAVAAVIRSPAHIQPYAARRNAATRSALAAAAGIALPCVMSMSAIVDSSRTRVEIVRSATAPGRRRPGRR